MFNTHIFTLRGTCICLREMWFSNTYWQCIYMFVFLGAGDCFGGGGGLVVFLWFGFLLLFVLFVCLFVFVCILCLRYAQ